MRKFLGVLLSILLILNFASCQRQKAPPEKQDEKKDSEKEEKPDKKEGEKLLDNYMRALVLRDSNGIKLFYSENLKQSSGNFIFAENPHPNGFMIDAMEEKEGKLEGKVTLLSVTTGKPYFSLDESTITIIKEKGTYVIDKIEQSKSSEVTEKDKALFMKEEGDVKGKEILKIDEVPEFTTPQGGTPGQKFSIGREGFGPIAGDSKGEKLALSTKGKYPALMTMEAKEKKVKPIDLYFEETVESIAWSQDGKFLAAEMLSKTGSKLIYVYDVEKGEKVDDPMKNVLKPAKYSVNTPYWISDNELVFNVSGLPGASPDEQKNVGSYKFDVKNTSLTKF